jgi:hypothetical protein
MQAHQWAHGPLGLDPLFAVAGHAPSESDRMRPMGRTRELARALSASVRKYTEVSNCASGKRCGLTGVAAYLSLSEPSIAGESATVTATIRQNTPSPRRPRDYETVLITLARRGAAWTVVRERQLGIS